MKSMVTNLWSLLQQTAEPEQLGRSEMLPPRTEFLHSRLAEVETALHVEHVVVNELRARLVEEHTRYMDQRVRADTLARDLAEAQILNDQVQDKFSTVAYVPDYVCRVISNVTFTGLCSLSSFIFFSPDQ